MDSSQVTVQLYTIREAMAEDRGAALTRLAGLGFSSVELYEFVDIADTYAELLGERGFVVPAGHSRLLGEDVSKIFAAAQTIGMPTVIQHWSAPERWEERESVVALARDFNEVAKRAADHGLQIGYHNHPWEVTNRIDGVIALEVFADHLDGVWLEVEPYWAAVGGTAAPALLERLGDRVKYLHVRDGPATANDAEQVAVGSGSIDIRAILAAAPQALPVIELDRVVGDVYDALRDSLAYLTARA